MPNDTLTPDEVADDQAFGEDDGADTANAVDKHLNSDQDDNQQNGGRSQLDNLQDANDLKNKLSGEGGEGGAAGEAGAESASEAGSVAGGASSGSGAAASEAAGGSAAGTMGGAAGGAATGTAAGGAATGAAAGMAAAEGTAAAGTAAAGLGATVASGPAAPITATAVAVATVVTTKKGRKLLLGGCITVFGLFLMPLGMTLLVVLIFFLPILGGGASSGEAAGLSGNSTKLTISKKASITKIPKDTVGAQVTYTITVANTTSKDATNINIFDKFSSTPLPGFAGEITGYEASFVIDKVAGGGNVSKTYTVTIPHTDFDPGYILFNSAKSSGTIDGNQEEANSGATVIIGNPPTGPPAFSPLKGSVFVSGYTFLQDTGGGHLHPGLDIASSEGRWEIFSPFAQPAQVTFVGGDCGASSYGEYVILQSGEWEVLMSHFACDTFQVKEGETVSSDKELGVTGLTGLTTGLHVHYEVHKNGEKVNPADYNATTSHP